MRVLMTTTSSSLMDGINRHILTIATALHKRGVDVAVCITRPGGELADALCENGVKAYSLNAASGHDFRILWRLDRIMKEFKPDICHIHVLPFMGKVLFSTKYKKLKYVVTVHGTGDPITQMTLRIRMEVFLDKVFSLKFSEYCCVSEGVSQFLEENYGRKGVVIYNPIEFGARKHESGVLHDLLHLETTVMLIGTACRFVEQKNPVAFMEVFCRVLSENENIHAVLMGDGDESFKAAMLEVQGRYDCGDRIHWLGYRSDAARLVGDLDCFVMTSHWEGLPTTLLEAIAVKTPIAFLRGGGGLLDFAGMYETHGPIGIVADAGDVKTLSDKIRSMLSDTGYRRRISENAWNVGARFFDVGRVVEKLIGVYERVREDR